jgi:hypothetical protein
MNNLNPLTQAKFNAYNSYGNQSVFKDFERQMIPSTKSVLYNPEITREEDRHLAAKAGIITLIVGAALALASRRFRLFAEQHLNEIRVRMGDLLRSTAERGDASLFTRAKIYTYRFGYRVATSFTNFLGNIDAGKNYITGKITNNIPIVSKGIQKLNSKLRPFFKGTVKKASLNKYKSADKAALELKTLLDGMAAKSPELRQAIGNSGDDIVNAVNGLSRRSGFESRVNELTRILRKSVKEYNTRIDDMVTDTRITRTADDLFNRTISLDIARTNLIKHNANISALHRAVSFTQKDKVSTLNRLLNEITLNTKIKPDAELISKVQKAISNYAKSSTPANERAVISVLDDVATKINHPKVLPLLSEARTAIRTQKVGQIQRLKQGLEAALESGKISTEEFKAATKQMKAIERNLNKAVQFEKDNLAGRWLDIEIGPVPFLETFSMALPVAALGNEIYQSETKEEKVSQAIQYAPAIAGGLGAWVVASLKGLYGFKALSFSLASGILFNRLGTYIDNKYYSKGKEWNSMKALAGNNIEKSGTRIFEV